MTWQDIMQLPESQGELLRKMWEPIIGLQVPSTPDNFCSKHERPYRGDKCPWCTEEDKNEKQI